MAGTSIHKVLMRAIKGTQKPQLRQQKQQDVFFGKLEQEEFLVAAIGGHITTDDAYRASA